MEEFVIQKVEQLLSLQYKWAINRIEIDDVVAYALNKLPAYYATTKKEVIEYTREIQEKQRANIDRYCKEGIAKFAQEVKIGARINEEENLVETQLIKLKQGLAQMLNMPMLENTQDNNKILRYVQSAIKYSQSANSSQNHTWI